MKLSRLLRYSPITWVEGQEGPEPAPDTRTFWVVCYWPDRKVSYARGIGGIGDTIRTALASGATRCEVEPEWQWDRRGAA